MHRTSHIVAPPEPIGPFTLHSLVRGRGDAPTTVAADLQVVRYDGGVGFVYILVADVRTHIRLAHKGYIAPVQDC